MALELQQQLRLTQQLIMTPQLQMAIKLLQLSRLELMDAIREELQENPALDEIQESISKEKLEKSQDSNTSEKEPAKEVTIEDKINSDIDWSNYIDEYNSVGRINFESESKDTPRYETFISQNDTLKDHLLWQLLMIRGSEEEKEIGSSIIGNLNNDGYLELAVEEIAATGNFQLESVESVLKIMQAL